MKLLHYFMIGIDVDENQLFFHFIRSMSFLLSHDENNDVTKRDSLKIFLPFELDLGVLCEKDEARGLVLEMDAVDTGKDLGCSD